VNGPAPFELWALHLPKPSLNTDRDSQARPGAHGRTLDRIRHVIREASLPVVVAGDLNLVDRGRGYQMLTADLDDASRSAWGGPTAKRSWLPLLFPRVDHILMPHGWCADRAARFDVTGSDHRGVRARLGPCPGNEDQ
jgi:endonuclease/exonuclease/phosphatase (EEP) superfamily protein YafD